MKAARKVKHPLNLPAVLVTVLALVGFVITSYLTYLHYANTRSFCDLSESISCDVVTTSIYSEVFGIPVSVMGMVYFIFNIFLVMFVKSPKSYLIVFLITLFVLFPSYYLTGIEAFVLKAWCILCETSKVLMVLTLIISFTQIKKWYKDLLRLSVPIILAGLIAVVVTFFAQTGNVTKKDYSGFVQSLNEKGVVYYKSIRCNNCKRQEKMFGKAYQKLNSVECHPDGQTPQPELCLKRRIDKTPTFLIEIDNKEIKRLEGLNSLEDIARWAEVPFEK